MIDSAKCIADGIANPDVDVWKFYMKEETPKAALPVGVILTLSATGSEMSASSVITNTELGLKRGFNSPGHRPLFSICNPELTYTSKPIPDWLRSSRYHDAYLRALFQYWGEHTII